MKARQRLAMLCVLCMVAAGCTPANPVDEEALRRQEAEQKERNTRGYALYQEAVGNMEMQASIDLTMVGTVTVQEGNEKHDMVVETDFKLAGDPTSPRIYKKVSHTGSKDTVVYTQYYRDGVSYYSDSYQQYYETSSTETANRTIRQYRPVTLTEAAFTKTSFVEKEGETEVVVTPDGERIEDEVLSKNGWFATMFGSALTEEDPGRVTEAGASFGVNADGYFTRYTLFYVVETKERTYRVRLESTVHRVAERVEIEFPDTSGYQNKSEAVGNTMDEKTLEALPAVMEGLFEEDGTHSEQFDTRYAALCRKYGEEPVRAAIQWYENYLRTQEIGTVS